MIEKLMARVMARAAANPDVSWTAKLLASGEEKVIKKFGEEAVELIMASQQKNKQQMIAESADVLYHMVVLWYKLGIAPAEVAEELLRREARSGIDEKASRQKS